MNQVRNRIHAEYAYVRGITGYGITAAVMDTGDGVRKMSSLQE